MLIFQKVFCLISALTVLSLAGTFYSSYLSANEQENLAKNYLIRGIDISHHQKEIDWPLLDQNGINFVIMKATEGGNFKDPRFKINWHKSKQTNLLRGAYHFYTFCKKALLQAQNFIQVVPKESNTLAPVVDIEFIGNCKRRPSQAQFKKQIGIYLKIIEKHYKQKVIIYTSPEVYKKYKLVQFKRNPLWLRNYERSPVVAQHWTFWQYSNKGKIPGIKTRVDLNVFHGTRKELDKLRQP